MKEFFALSFTNPFTKQNTENTTVVLSKISPVYTHGILEITLNLESGYQVQALYNQLTL